MNPDYPPLVLSQPRTEQRRRERPRPVPTPPEVIARRAQIAARLREQVQPLAERLRAMTNQERKAVFYKLEHEGPIPAKEWGLKPIAEPTEHFTLAVPRDIERLDKQINAFETSPIKHGIVPNAQMAKITAIREGDPMDRLSEELFSRYEELITQEHVIFEVEMLSLAQGSRQQRDELQQIRHDLAAALGVQGNYFEHEEIKGTCRAVIRCSGAMFKRLVGDAQWQTRLTWFEARPEFQTFHQVAHEFSVQNLGAFVPPANEAPVVCVIDSGVASGNPFLRPVTRDELVRSFLKAKPDDPSDGHGHGSGVASLVSYYALNLGPGAQNIGRVWIACARVLDENNEGDELFSKTLAEVIEHFVPLGVKIFNLSVNIKNRQWTRDAKRTVPRRSWIARKLDHLSREKDVVIVVSAGNLLPLDVRHLIASGTAYPNYLSTDEARILDPAQAALALTVGAIAPSTLAEGPVGRSRAMAEMDHPAPFTRSGPGISAETKPELVDFGGNYIRDEESDIVRMNRGSSVVMASNKLTPAVAFDSGTSFAAPRVAHKLGVILGDLRSLGLEPSAALLKAFLVNSARSPIDLHAIETLCHDLGPDGGKQACHVLGQGVADAQRATNCDDHQVIMYFQGVVESNKITFFDVPVPGDLENAANGRKRLTVTVTFQPDVQRWGLEQYLGTLLKWRMFRGDVSREGVIAAMSKPDEDGAEQPDLPEEIPFGPAKYQHRSRGTVQHASFEWSTHRSAYSANHYTLAITAYERWARTNPEPVPFAVVVRLEEDSQSTPIYNAVRTALINLRVRARA